MRSYFEHVRDCRASVTNEIDLIAKDGYSTIVFVALVAIALIFFTRNLSLIPRVIFLVLAVDLVTLTIFFFRDPERSLPADVDPTFALVSPADGKVVEIKEVGENEYIEGPARQLSIFLSVLDVHVNRIPADGTIERADYFAGEYLVAWHPKASEKNERAEFRLKHPSGTKIIFRQITGILARRIVYRIEKGDQVKAGDRFGIMKFGSRMDVIVPAELEFKVSEGDRVIGGHTVLGYFTKSEEGV